MKGSGKQILLRVLRDLSSRCISGEELETATDRIRAALLFHGSTSDGNFRMARSLCWASSPLVGPVERQGLAVEAGKVFLSDFFERMLEMPGLEKFMQQSYEGFSKDDYEAAIWALWCLLSAPQMFTELLEVEVGDAELAVDDLIQNMSRKYKYFFENGENTDHS